MIGDTLQDPRVAQLPIVAAAPRFRAYAGHPLADEHGNCVGTFCVFDLEAARIRARPIGRRWPTSPRSRNASCCRTS